MATRKNGHNMIYNTYDMVWEARRKTGSMPATDEDKKYYKGDWKTREDGHAYLLRTMKGWDVYEYWCTMAIPTRASEKELKAFDNTWAKVRLEAIDRCHAIKPDTPDEGMKYIHVVTVPHQSNGGIHNNYANKNKRGADARNNDKDGPAGNARQGGRGRDHKDVIQVC